ncbi:MAG: phage tail sheath family protein, partial [Angelakisella sp.]
GKFHVVTWRGSIELERQLVTAVSELKSNDWIAFSKTGAEDTLAANAGTPLAGGADGTVANADHVKALEAFGMQQLGAIACPSNETEVKDLYVAFAKRMVQEDGNYLQVVVPDSMTADFEGVISVKNGVVLEDTTTITNVQATAYVAGATAACPLTESLTNATYVGAVDVDTRYTRTQQEDFARSGQMVFLPPAQGGIQATIQKDINSLVTFTNTKTYALSKNKIIRTLFYICDSITALGNRFKGVMANNEDGRAQLKAAILELFRDLEKQSVLRDVSPEDITVEPGKLLDAVVIHYVVKPVDVMETFYNSIVVSG